jgi:hypothetical protein
VSIVVAAIGLFGVLILIPFAVRNAQIAMDQESAMTAAQNGLADFEAWGYRDPARWYNPDAAGVDEFVLGGGPIDGRAFCIDPLFVAEGLGGAWPNVAWQAFPYYDPTWADFVLAAPVQFPPIERISVYDRAGGPALLSQALAQRLMTARDDIAYDIPDQDFEPPRALFTSLDTVDPANRQSTGQFSWLMFVVPEDLDENRYRVYVVVFNRRNLYQFDNVYQVLEPLPNDASASHPLAYGGGDVALAVVGETNGAPQGDIRRNDFVVLLNQYPTPGGRVQFDICRVAEVYRNESYPNNPATADYRLTLQGGDFDFIPDYQILQADALPPEPDDTTVITYAVHLPNVISVYSRTIRLQTKSNYSLSP